MNKKFLRFIAILIVLFVGTMNYSTTLQTPFVQFLNTVASWYHMSIIGIESAYNRHFFQAEMIENLEAALKKEKEELFIQKAYQSKIADLEALYSKELAKKPQVTLVRAIAYEEFGNTNRVWLDVKDYNSSKIYALVYKEYVAGIVVPKNTKPLGLLNKDAKSSYAVLVGKSNAPGIAHGNDEENIVVTFIPAWYDVQVGDEVVTSGLDRIFFKGLKVGRVVSVSTAEGYQKAVVQPYYTMDRLDYFYMITKVE